MGLDSSDARPSYLMIVTSIYLLNLELRIECSRIVDMAGIFQNSWRGAAAEAEAKAGGAAVEADAIQSSTSS